MEETKRGIRVYKLIGIFLFLFAIVSYFDRLVIALAGPKLIEEFGWSQTLLGTIFSAFGVGYMITQIPGGWFADRFGARKIFIYGGLGWAITTGLIPLVRSFSAMVLLRGLLGAAEGVYFPSATSALGRWIPKKSHSYYVGLLFSGNKMGSLIATPLMAWMIASYGWKTPFWFCAALSFLMVFVWVFFFKDDPSLHPMVSKTELEEIKEGKETAPVKVEKDKAKVSPLRQYPVIWIYGLAFFFLTYAIWFNLTWLPTYLVTGKGFTIIKMGLWAMLPFMGEFIGLQGGGWLSDKLIARGVAISTSRNGIIYASWLLGSIIYFSASNATSGVVAVILIAISVMLFNVGGTPFMTFPLDISKENAGVLLGVITTGGAVSAIVCPLLAGYLADNYGWNSALLVGAIAPVIAAALVFIAGIIRAKEKQAKQGAAA